MIFRSVGMKLLRSPSSSSGAHDFSERRQLRIRLIVLEQRWTWKQETLWTTKIERKRQPGQQRLRKTGAAWKAQGDSTATNVREYK
ncbi:hypothetical protein PUN28_018247 [Cardiocondyla obscurior]|uniref:Uncharacterized protein n=1 Tax=Cardiocondyla obscurior TaxID=286306 RepID=A0AAW2EJ97_9HYME